MKGPARTPTMMKPITGEIRKRANVGMTIPAAPRIVSASLKPEVPKLPWVIPALEQGGGFLSPQPAGIVDAEEV